MKKKHIKLIVIIGIIILILVFLFLIYKNLFASNNNSRNSDISNYKITNNEINSAKDKIKELEEVKSIDIHINNNSKIVKIIVLLSNDVAFDKINALANEVVSNFSEKNIGYYDFEFYVDSENAESEIYPKIGYKFRANSGFSW